MDVHELWRAALGELELSLTKANFTTWFKHTFISSFDGQRIIIAVPNAFTRSWLEKKYHDTIMKALRNVTNNAVRDITYRVELRTAETQPTEAPTVAIDSVTQSPTPATATLSFGATQPTAATISDFGLNPRYTFDAFVVGKANELAHAASMAAATQPGTSYNPVFIYGGSGLGKTHLLQAIGHQILRANPDVRILYATCERFTNDFIHAVRNGRGKEFKDTYRTVDVLLIDDVQFMTGKEGTQEEFFHTFNALHQQNKQIVLTSDRSPKDIQGLETRLLTRFEWGMIVDVSNPDYETRVAIVEAKAREKHLPIDGEILRYVAGAIQSNIRELEGALNKIVAYHQFKNTTPSIDSVQTLLQSFAPNVPKRTITPKRLIEIVVQHYDIHPDELLGKSREQRLAHPRQITMYLLRHEAKCSFPAIGLHLGGRDHTTAMHACTKISDLLKENEELKRDILQLREKLYAG